MKILYVAAEATPYLKTGGLADVAGSLPQALTQQGHEVRLVLPMHRAIIDKYKEKTKKLTSFYVDVGWKHEYCGVHLLTKDGVPTYFLDNEYYFNRPSPYGQYDDGERYIFFAKAATRLARVLDWPVDIIHANDWHAALVPVFVNDYRTGDAFYDSVRTVLTIHNLKYQGQYAPEVFYWTNLNGFYASDYDLKFYDTINFLKGGIVHANQVNVVSPTYAEEIHYPFFAEGLESVINTYAYKISGILNGLDMDHWDPASDPLIQTPYDARELSGKKACKQALQEAIGLPIRPNTPLIGMVSRLTAMKGFDLVRYILDEFLQEDVQLVVLGTGEETYEEMFRYFEQKYPDRCAAHLYYSDREAHQIYAGADLFLMPSISEPCGLSQMIAMRYGAVPVVREAGGLMDSVEAYNAYEGSGDGFRFAHVNAHELLFKLKDALQVYHKLPEDFNRLRIHGMKKDFSWAQSSKEYCKLYEAAQ